MPSNTFYMSNNLIKSSIEQEEVIPVQNIVYQTRKITDIAVDMNFMQMRILDVIIQKGQPVIKEALFKKRSFEQLELFKSSLNKTSGLIEISFKMKDFGVKRQFYKELRENLRSLVTLPVQMKEYGEGGTVWDAYTTLIAGVKFDTGVKRCEWNDELRCFEYLDVPKVVDGYRKRDVIVEFRRDILEAIITGGPNGYIQYIKEVLAMMTSLYSNRIYKLICGFYNARAIESGQNIVTRISIEEFRKRMGLNDALSVKKIYDSSGTNVIRHEYTPRTVEKVIDGKKVEVEDTHLYKNIRDLKRRVLDVGKTELKEKSNLYFEYRLIDSSGNKVKDTEATHIEFTVIRKEKGQINLTTSERLINGLLTIIYGKQEDIPVDIHAKLSQENVLELRNRTQEASRLILQSDDASESESIRIQMTKYLKSL